MNVLLIGESSAVRLDKQGIISVSFDEIEKYISSARVLLNRSDAVSSIEKLPNVKAWEKSALLKGCIAGKSLSNSIVNGCYTASNLFDGYTTVQTATVYTDLYGAKLFNAVKNLGNGRVELLSFAIPNMLSLHGYWIVVSENSLGGISIYCGYNEIIILNRILDKSDTLKSVVKESLDYLKKFGYHDDVPVIKFSFIKTTDLKKSLDGFICKAEEYGDLYFIKKVYESSKDITPIVFFKGKIDYVKTKSCKCIRQALIIAVPILLLFLILLGVHHYDLDNKISSIKKQKNIVTESIDSITSKVDDMFNKESSESVNIERPLKKKDNLMPDDYIENEFQRQEKQSTEDNLHNTKKLFAEMRQEIARMNNSIKPRIQEMERVINSEGSAIYWGNADNSVLSLGDLEFIFPKGIHLSSYSYSFKNENGQEYGQLELILHVDSKEKLSKFIESIPYKTKGYKVQDVSPKGKNRYKIILIK